MTLQVFGLCCSCFYTILTSHHHHHRTSTILNNLTKKPHSVKYEEPGGQHMSPLRPIHLFGNSLFWCSWTTRLKWVGTPSCRNHIFGVTFKETSPDRYNLIRSFPVKSASKIGRFSFISETEYVVQTWCCYTTFRTSSSVTFR